TITRDRAGRSQHREADGPEHESMPHWTSWKETNVMAYRGMISSAPGHGQLDAVILQSLPIGTSYERDAICPFMQTPTCINLFTRTMVSSDAQALAATNPFPNAQKTSVFAARFATVCRFRCPGCVLQQRRQESLQSIDQLGVPEKKYVARPATKRQRNVALCERRNIGEIRSVTAW